MIRDAVKELLPPDMSAVARWRLAMFAMSVLTLAHIGYACGWFAFIGLGAGFAKAEDVVTVQASFRTIQLDLLEQRIHEAQRLRCEANKAGSYVSRNYYASQVSRMHREYFDIAKFLLDIPTCVEVSGP